VQGAQGNIGPVSTVQGAQGAPGPTSTGGGQGAQGAQGNPGPPGPGGAGPQGSQGAPGPVGANGGTGAQGAQGATGPPSDKRFKNNITKLENVLDKTKKLEGVRFVWDETHPKIIKNKSIFFQAAFSGESIGLIAQEVEKIVPELVDEDDDGFKSVGYGQLVSLGIGSIQEEQKRIESIYKRINKLKELIGG
jgi:hypothetical protein